METLKVKNLTFRYPKMTNNALDDISFSLFEGEFTVICGASGCGKSTLLRQFKTSTAPNGEQCGEIIFQGKELSSLDHKLQSQKIGFISQSAENQIVTDKVWHELAFGLENLGTDNRTMHLRVAEMASFFGIEKWFNKSTAELSGGQKQILNLASVMVMNPEILLLDEPTSQLDPIAASEFLNILSRINRDFGTTILMTEHRLEEVFFYCDRVLVMEQARLIADGNVESVGIKLREEKSKMFDAMPTSMKIWSGVPDSGDTCPVSVSQGKEWLKNYSKTHELKPIAPDEAPIPTLPPLAEADNIFFRYAKNSPDVLTGTDLKAYPGELLAVLGGNGTGKSTLLSLICGTHKPYRGKVKINGEDISKSKYFPRIKVAALPQNPQSLFLKKTVEQDLMEVLSFEKIEKSGHNKKVQEILSLCNLTHLKNRHPYDLSGGEQQRAALAKVLLTNPDILLLDEPTKGFDAAFKSQFAAILNELLKKNVAIIMVSHDIEFCAKYATRCAMLFDGKITAQDTPRSFFANNNFYTTAAHRIARDILPNAVTPEDIIVSCGGKTEKLHLKTLPPAVPPNKKNESDPTQIKKSKPLYKKISAVLGTVTLLISLAGSLGWLDLSAVVGTGEFALYLPFIVPVIFFLFAFSGSSNKHTIQTINKRTKLSKQSKFSVFICLAAIPLTLFIGSFYLDKQKYLFISLLIMLECICAFFISFEGRKPQARELVIIAALCALAVSARAAFYMLPQFKPVTAIVIISGAALGAQTGFVVGTLSMLLSNVIFAQGPWTPWQMFAMGLIGFFAGFFYNKGLLSGSKTGFGIFGAVCALVIYGGIMNPAAAIMAHTPLSVQTLAAHWATGLPMDIVHAAATFFFLYFFSDVMLEKLNRIKIKYGILQ